jgi:Cu/Ag efflux pump CusA
VLKAAERRRLQDKARNLRERIVEVTFSSGGAHIGGALSQHDILVALYYRYLKVDPGRPHWPDRDRFVLSKGTRLRPILMTSVATVCGHLPLTLVSGPGAAARNSIGLVLVAGMAIGTAFTLFFVPAIYLLIARDRHGGRAASGGPGLTT